MKVVLIIGIIICSCLIGKGISLLFERKKIFWSELNNFCNKLEVEINFSATKIIHIITNFKTSSNDLIAVLNEYIKRLDGKQELNGMLDNCKYLNEAEKQIVLSFLNSLGKSDTTNQIKELEKYETKILEQYEKSNSVYQKYGKLAVKLAFFLGLAISILIM